MDERVVIMGFQQWLAGVTERIQQTMHYQFDGKADVCVMYLLVDFTVHYGNVSKKF